MEQSVDEHTLAEEHDSNFSEAIHPRPDAAKRPQRHANVYDAVAGRISYETSLASATSNERTPARAAKPPRLSRHTVHTPILAPEEVLFRRKAAPERFSEFDVYMAHDRNLPDGGRGSLPDSDLLKAVHSYASHFYSTLGGQKHSAQRQVGSRNIDERSMDESALLAFGILLEEAGKDVLGKRGDMVLTEGVEITGDVDAAPENHTDIKADSQTLTVNAMRDEKSVGFADLGSWKRASKRRKVTDPDV